MFRLILVIVLFLLSLLTVFKAPTSWLWYVSILVTEFPWIFLVITVALLLWPATGYNIPVNVFAIASVILFALPIAWAYRISASLNTQFDEAFNTPSTHERNPFQLSRMITGIGAKQLPYQTITYNPATSLTLDYYRSGATGKRPCIVVVHGGSWKGGDSKQLPELNSHFAQRGYHVAAINYRLAPQHIYPAPVEDVHAAFDYLKQHAEELNIDTARFILLGRSAGGQIVLSAAYTLQEPGLVGVISYYGPVDMVWGYAHPTNPLVLDSRKVMEDYLGGTFHQVPQQYIQSSPNVTASANAVPTLLIHGQNDPLVAYEHATRLSEKLKQYNVKHFVLTLPWATHACDYSLNGPAGQLATYTVDRFLDVVAGN